MLYAERKRLADFEAREAAGESLWTEEIPRSARVKIAANWDALENDARYGPGDAVRGFIRALMRHHAGVENPIDSSRHWLNIEDPDLSLSYLEAVMLAYKDVAHEDMTGFERWVNRVFTDHRIAYRMVEGQIVPLSSDELHVEVVEPTLRLLVGSRFESAHAAYLKALKEISDPGDAITDAATALQELLVALGCKGGSLGPLWTSAKKKGLVTAHDKRLIDGIGEFMDWANADRSTTGDAHKHSDATRADAWLMVHVVGALIVRLVQADLRGTPEALS